MTADMLSPAPEKYEYKTEKQEKKMENFKTSIVKEKDFTVRPFGFIIIGDPDYLEKINNQHKDAAVFKKLVYVNRTIRKAHHEAKVRLRVTKTSHGSHSFHNIELSVASVLNTDPKTRDLLFDTLLNGRYHPDLLSKKKSLGCDTARFYINIDGNDEEIHTGADGYYGNVIVYKQKMAYNLSVVLDYDLYSEAEIEQLIRYLFHVESEGEWRCPAA